MGKYRRIALAVVAIVVLGVIATIALTGRSTEPVYQGKTLSEWLSIWGPIKTNLTASDSMACSEAVRQIGTNGIPFLMRMFRTRDTDLRQRLLKVAQKQRLVPVHYVSARDIRSRGTMGLFMLGADAKSAVPELMEVYDVDTDSNVRTEVANILGNIGPGARAGIPCLLRSLGSTNDFERVFATMALGKIHADATNVIPVLIINLGDKSKGVQHASASALGQYGSTAKAAIPALIKLRGESPPVNYRQGSYGSVYSEDDSMAPMISPDPGGAATRALSRIDRETYDTTKHKELWEGK